MNEKWSGQASHFTATSHSEDAAVATRHLKLAICDMWKYGLSIFHGRLRL